MAKMPQSHRKGRVTLRLGGHVTPSDKFGKLDQARISKQKPEKGADWIAKRSSVTNELSADFAEHKDKGILYEELRDVVVRKMQKLWAITTPLRPEVCTMYNVQYLGSYLPGRIKRDR